MKTLAPGSLIGILGGGQLARMTALAAARLGYPCHVFCQDQDEPAVAVCQATTFAPFTDGVALAKFAEAVDVVTLEWENIPLASVEVVSSKVAVHPSPNVLSVSQDRESEKNFAQSLGIGTAEFKVINSAAELEAALKSFPKPSILKSARMGYDGKGQVKLVGAIDAHEAWAAVGGKKAVLEAYVDFACEVSVIVARREDGATAIYPVVENIHKDQILFETHAPANIDKAIIDEATHRARTLAEKLSVVGLLAVEMFVLKQPDADGHRVLINEIAPRPHNSGHWTIDACAVSQFEQLVRAVCGLPLGSPAAHSRAVMTNLLGDEIQRWQAFLTEPNACLHLYGKKESRKGRKMGHVTHLKGAW